MRQSWVSKVFIWYAAKASPMPIQSITVGWSYIWSAIALWPRLLHCSENEPGSIKYSQHLGSPLNKRVWCQGEVSRPQLHGSRCSNLPQKRQRPKQRKEHFRRFIGTPHWYPYLTNVQSLVDNWIFGNLWTMYITGISNRTLVEICLPNASMEPVVYIVITDYETFV